MADRAIICTAPSKSFNLAGLQSSNIIIPDDTLRRRFKDAVRCSGYSQLNAMGLVATEAAYRDGASWLSQCLEYIHGNLLFACDFVNNRIPGLIMSMPEGTYFAWIDCKSLGLDKGSLDEAVVKGAGLWLDSGHIFGKEGEGFQRIVTACPRSILEEALERLKKAVGDLTNS